MLLLLRGQCQKLVSSFGSQSCLRFCHRSWQPSQCWYHVVLRHFLRVWAWGGYWGVPGASGEVEKSWEDDKIWKSQVLSNLWRKLDFSESLPVRAFPTPCLTWLGSNVDTSLFLSGHFSGQHWFWLSNSSCWRPASFSWSRSPPWGPSWRILSGTSWLSRKRRCTAVLLIKEALYWVLYLKSLCWSWWLISWCQLSTLSLKVIRIDWQNWNMWIKLGKHI